ncbi:glycoside hydrolase family 37 protein [Moesziomyces antarcticus]|uniref:Related to trehalase n=2 Tax=Pseudozyma antarctica TaxID=84753 RepID=A0A5C3FPC2_PSEA2|nr:glycoside hydrolase family 37 protein [Moesziomyces antarcticus]GAK65251.1 glycoside hydrolase family 37 protein [Moesziomyces antarcticus]SPO46254.1 related to trehalase precursor [Moesziomyces antarcticus]
MRLPALKTLALLLPAVAAVAAQDASSSMSASSASMTGSSTASSASGSSSLTSTAATASASSSGTATSSGAASSSSVNPLTEKPPAAVPSATTTPSAMIPSGPLPPSQELCTSPIYCPGPLLQAVQLAGIFEDSKTFVDKATSRPESEVLDNFNKLGGGNTSNITYEEIVQFVDDNFVAEGVELVPADLGDEFVQDPEFLQGVEDEVVRDWLKQVHSYWELLARTTNSSSPSGVQCDGCVSSFIPFNESRVFVVPGGRFRELYYWDTFFVIEGLITSQLQSVVKAILENFGDLIDRLGFIPNGNRVYYENRSQPPFFTLMIDKYIEAYNDTSVLQRFLPLLEKEMEFWRNNRTIEFTSPFTNSTHNITHYKVDTSAPRPESYLEDYKTVEDASESGLELNDTQKAQLYSDLASGAESGSDYSGARWSKRPTINLTDTIPAQRFLNTAQQLPVDLNAILFACEQKLSAFYKVSGNGTQSNMTRANYWAQQAQARKQAVLDVFWDPSRKFFYDFNVTLGDRAPYYTPAGFFPLWAQILPQEFVNETISLDQRRQNLQGVFSGLRYIIDRFNGTIPASLVTTGQQWDFANAWPPHTYIALEALRNLPDSLSAGPQLPAENGTFALIPMTNGTNQLGQTEDSLPIQPIEYQPGSMINETQAGATDPNNPEQEVNPIMNVGNSTTGESWRDELVRELANRYVASALCSWRATGGKLNTTDPNFQAVPDDVLTANGLNASTAIGNMFEKFNASDINAAGGGGEYEVQVGFGWTNGVAIWLGGQLGANLTRPECPPVVAQKTTSSE